jgi:hypothetical protein
MKKLLVLVAAFAVVNEASAWSNPFAKKVVAPAPVVELGLLEKAKATANDFSKNAVAALEAKIVAQPIPAVLVAMVVALVAEQVAAAIYNNFIASDDFIDEDEDLDIA